MTTRADVGESDPTGSQDASARANRRWKKILADYEAPPLDVAIEDALTDFVDRRRRATEDA